jgi:hypothetical protein
MQKVPNTLPYFLVELLDFVKKVGFLVDHEVLLLEWVLESCPNTEKIVEVQVCNLIALLMFDLILC